ncbi:FIG domain-containing protein [Geminicoccus flavidas]|uniref:hypothetical protein n=1 Tax=Geminicoccus flavidas TaxID=2506407 RepID=UPI001357DD8B|nr:hypothetical protein [Geminicoccus flavidas]
MVLRQGLAGIIARYAEDGIGTVNDVPARVSPVCQLSDAVISVVLTSSFSPEEVARSVEIARCLGDAARGARVICSAGLELTLVAPAS